MRIGLAGWLIGPLALASGLSAGAVGVVAAARHVGTGSAGAPHPGIPSRASGAQLADVRRDLADDSRWRPSSEGPRSFYFTRAKYSGVPRFYGRGPGSWAIDWPKADRQFLYGLRRLTRVDAYERDHPLDLTDPELWRYPFLYALEVGYMRLTEPEIVALRRYLQAGGFLFIDDFWGTWEWRNFEVEIGRVLPGAEIVELPLTHPLFHSFYDIDRVIQVPSVRIVNGGPTYEQDGYVPHVRAIFADDGRLMVLINWNTDLGDAWEWVDNPYYPLQYSNFAYQLAVNAILYAMSH